MTVMARPLRLGLAETKLLFRGKITLFSALVAPVGLCVLSWFSDRDNPPERWGPLLGSRFVLLLLLSVFMTSMMVFTGRRQSLVLKRLRTSELSDAGVIAGITAPMVVLGLGQLLLYFGFCVAIGAPMPENPLLVLLGVVLGVFTALAAGMATAALSKSVEATHITSFPVVILVMTGLFLQDVANEAVALGASVMPLIGAGDLVVKGWSGAAAGAAFDQLPGVSLGLASTALWAVVFGLVIAGFFRWEPRP
ncbi:ABC transporter permease [Amycolatopsis suaedae]|uniref:ABC-2 type transporter transmembrane domain-containing protein n=1 Tax=Amycolatopsis suaedae TaxID=2510978 RepID=A0A4Q7JA71_9PSEU|nr:ABC transporter permease [Amycolatopsis suaedae]RZQ64159.1 hypothetical protein EWH70_09190 [Amycolatopsis suaedae]